MADLNSAQLQESLCDRSDNVSAEASSGTLTQKASLEYFAWSDSGQSAEWFSSRIYPAYLQRLSICHALKHRSRTKLNRGILPSKSAASSAGKWLVSFDEIMLDGTDGFVVDPLLIDCASGWATRTWRFFLNQVVCSRDEATIVLQLSSTRIVISWWQVENDASAPIINKLLEDVPVNLWDLVFRPARVTVLCKNWGSCRWQSKKRSTCFDFFASVPTGWSRRLLAARSSEISIP